MRMMRAYAGSEFMNIKQAAVLLNVSEVSLRRWTDSGKLPCLRVGARRERRFRREDLLAFLESETPRQASAKHPPFRREAHRRILLEGLPVPEGSHICRLYDSDLGRFKFAVPFLLDGLCAGEPCFFVAGRTARKAILDRLGKVYKGLAQAVADGRLTVSDGAPGAREMYDYLENAFIMTTCAGHQTMRLLGDMGWWREQGLEQDELFEYERRYNHQLARQFPVVTLCQYDVREFSGIGIHNALKCHEDTFALPLSRFL